MEEKCIKEPPKVAIFRGDFENAINLSQTAIFTPSISPNSQKPQKKITLQANFYNLEYLLWLLLPLSN